MISLTTQKLSVVLDKERLSILPFLKEFHARGFYLAGGTALALIFEHRESEDFDFFVGSNFSTEELFSFCQKLFIGRKIEKILDSKNTLWITVDEVKLSFFTSEAPILQPFIKTQYFDIASIYDIGAMKLGAIQHRATQKDYVDLAYIIREIGLPSLLQSFKGKYGDVISAPLLLKSLIYFDDVDSTSVKMLVDNFDWGKIQEELKNATKAYMSRLS